MSEQKAGAPTTAGESGAPAVPTNQMSPAELLALKVPSEESQTWVVAESRWKAENPTGAFDSDAVSFRYMPKEYNWFEVLWSAGILYGVFVGLPVVGGAWSVWRIGTMVGWW